MRRIFPKNESWGDGLLEEAAKAYACLRCFLCSVLGIQKWFLL